MEKPDKTPDLMRWMMRAAVALVLAASIVGGCNYFNQRMGLPNDHVGEEFLEQVIEEHTGISLDLTPQSE